MPFCTNCGAHVGENILYCPNCGKLLLQPPGPHGWNDPARAPIVPEEKRAFFQIQIFAIISLVSSIVGYGSYFFLLPGEMKAILPQGSSPASSLSNPGPFFQAFFGYLSYFLIATALITIASLFFLVLGLHSLSKIANEFVTPSRLAIVALVAVPLLLISVALLFQGLFELTQVPSSAMASSFLTLFLILIVSSIAGLVGQIGGVLLGIWRLGERYDKSLFKAAAIFFIIPFLYAIAPILVIVGVHELQHAKKGDFF